MCVKYVCVTYVCVCATCVRVTCVCVITCLHYTYTHPHPTHTRQVIPTPLTHSLPLIQIRHLDWFIYLFILFRRGSNIITLKLPQSNPKTIEVNIIHIQLRIICKPKVIFIIVMVQSWEKKVGCICDVIVNFEKVN